METSEIILREDGALIERTIKERNLHAEEDVLENLTADVTRAFRQVMTIPNWGLVNVNVGQQDALWSVPITRIPLRARFRLVQGVLVPMFASNAELEMPLVWQAPPEVRLVFAVSTYWQDNTVQVNGNYLFAFNQDKQGFRLPLPNLYDDCRLCAGEFDTYQDSAQACVVASLEQFERSKWNSDLMQTVAESQKFFRFKPTNETFETLPIDAPHWTTLCAKVATNTMERVVL